VKSAAGDGPEELTTTVWEADLAVWDWLPKFVKAEQNSGHFDSIESKVAEYSARSMNIGYERF
jgi:hypothetical protein